MLELVIFIMIVIIGCILAGAEGIADDSDL